MLYAVFKVDEMIFWCFTGHEQSQVHKYYNTALVLKTLLEMQLKACDNTVISIVLYIRFLYYQDIKALQLQIKWYKHNLPKDKVEVETISYLWLGVGFSIPLSL